MSLAQAKVVQCNVIELSLRFQSGGCDSSLRCLSAPKHFRDRQLCHRKRQRPGKLRSGHAHQAVLAGKEF